MRAPFGSFMEVGRQQSHADINSDNQSYLFGDQILGPVLVPWYKNHGLCRSQQLLKFFSDQSQYFN